LNQDNTNLRQVVTSLNDKVTSLNDKITSLDQEVKNLNDRVSILEFEKAILTIYDISNYLIPIPEMSQKNRIHFESIDKKRTSGIKKPKNKYCTPKQSSNIPETVRRGVASH